jgi:hypothetical protein
MIVPAVSSGNIEKTRSDFRDFGTISCQDTKTTQSASCGLWLQQRCSPGFPQVSDNVMHTLRSAPSGASWEMHPDFHDSMPVDFRSSGTTWQNSLFEEDWCLHVVRTQPGLKLSSYDTASTHTTWNAAGTLCRPSLAFHMFVATRG